MNKICNFFVNTPIKIDFIYVYYIHVDKKLTQ